MLRKSVMTNLRPWEMCLANLSSLLSCQVHLLGHPMHVHTVELSLFSSLSAYTGHSYCCCPFDAACYGECQPLCVCVGVWVCDSEVLVCTSGLALDHLNGQQRGSRGFNMTQEAQGETHTSLGPCNHMHNRPCQGETGCLVRTIWSCPQPKALPHQCLHPPKLLLLPCGHLPVVQLLQPALKHIRRVIWSPGRWRGSGRALSPLAPWPSCGRWGPIVAAPSAILCFSPMPCLHCH